MTTGISPFRGQFHWHRSATRIDPCCRQSSDRSEFTMAPPRPCPAGTALPLPPPPLRRLTALTRRGVLPGDLERWETEGGVLAGRLYPPVPATGTAVRTVIPCAGEEPR